jgi:hypothetical protein
MAMSAADEVRQVLAAWRKAKGWQPGMEWDPYTAAYVWPLASPTVTTPAKPDLTTPALHHGDR